MATLAPGPLLAPFVRTFTIVEAAEETTRVLIPDTALVMGFRYGGHADLIENRTAVRMPDFTLTGLRHAARQMRTSAGGGVILTMFREGGASAFFREPLHELFGDTVPLADLLGRDEIHRAAERIIDATSDATRASVVEQFLLDHRLSRRGDPIVTEAARAIRSSGGSIRVRDLARKLGISVNRLEERFRRAVGASPKQLASILRFQRAVSAYQRGNNNVSQLSVAAGYSDQSHFIRDFRARVGDSPGRFFGNVEHC